ncbi:MAG TPA: c-type cytochrome [Xanthomonadaceae bacterium]|nr:c-type cytochrome [Xanthomonadaceae bacterium]
MVPADPGTIARGRHLYVSRGCTGCHGDAGQGKLLFDAGPVARIVPSNLTRTVRDPAWTDDALAAAIDHAPRRRQAPPVAPTAEYGAYLAQVCTGCHGTDFRGGMVMVPDTPPTANLTPHPDAMGHWSRDDFVRVMRTGVRPDGRELHPMMPWREFGTMTDTELDALWAHFGTLPPAPMRQ